MGRRGFTLIELMISLLVTAIVGGALVRITLAQARYMDQQEAWRSARSVSRSGVNRLVSDLRILETAGGVSAAVAGGQDFTVRVPYAFGIMCVTNGAAAAISILPIDSVMYNAPGYSGFAYRTPATGTYTYVANTTAPVTLTGANTSVCTAAAPQGINAGSLGALPSINGSPAGRVIVVSGAIPVALDVGSIFFLYRQVRYQFKNSTTLPGRTGLFRTLVSTGAEEELATPFDNTARVNFYVDNAAVAQAAVPADLTTIRGLELVLNGASEQTPAGSPGPKTINLTTSVFFENRPD
jgi:prepilin-type N-terminal cleavage/methylation domain-containing protein